LIQRADANFVPKAACVSCHNNSFAAMAVGTARKNGFQVDEKTAAQQVKANVFGLEKLRDYLHQGFFAPLHGCIVPTGFKLQSQSAAVMIEPGINHLTDIALSLTFS
jgi:hypothetical protein